MRTILKVVVAILIAVTLLAVGLVALLGVGANEAVKSIEADHAKDAEYAMSASEFKAIKPAEGITYKAFVAEYGKPLPEQTQKVQAEGVKTVTIYYNVEGGELLDWYQFLFTDGVLSTKAHW